MQFDPPVLAHRGASAYAPENTMIAFTRALQLGVGWIEFDVMLAACGTPIVFHDETLDRTTNGTGFVGDFCYDYLKTLDAGSWFSSLFAGERIPALDQVLEFLVSTSMSCNLEIKPLPNQDIETVEKMWQVLKPYYPKLKDHILFSSFSTLALNRFRELNSECRVGLLLDDIPSNWLDQAESLSCQSIHISNDNINKDIASQIKQNKFQLLCYTVNDANRAMSLYDWGVDAVFSDNPDKIARFAY